MADQSIQDFPFFTIEGPPRERGISYGRQAARRIHKSEEIYVRAMERRGFQWQEVKRLAAEFAPAIARLDSRFMAEIEGIAEGAGVDLETVIVVNARSEIFNGRAPGDREAARAAQDAMPAEGCTSALALGKATRSGHLLQGQNWDFNAECVHSAIVLKVVPESGPQILTFVEAGGLARSGLNTAGIAVTANNLECEQDFDRTGMPLSMIRRRILEADTFAEAIGAVTAAERAVSNNMTVSQVHGDEAINLETTPDEVFALWPDDRGLFAHANHFQSPAAQVKVRDTSKASRTPCTLYRDRRVMAVLAARAGDLTVDDFKTALADTFATPHAVCRPPVEGRNGHVSSTVATVVFDPVAGLIHARPAPYSPDTAFTVYALNADAQDRIGQVAAAQ